jgi:hypothetical protein
MRPLRALEQKALASNPAPPLTMALAENHYVHAKALLAL